MVTVLHKKTGTSTRIVIEFDETTPRIIVTKDANVPIEFSIDADEHTSFITFKGETICPDRFSELALKEAFFPPELQS